MILAAGEGTRLRPLTNERPKCLVPYRGKALLDYQLKAINGAGISDIVVVSGYKGDMITGRPIQVVHNRDYHRTNMVASLFCAEAHFTEDILVSYGDIIYGQDLLGALLASTAGFAVAVHSGWKELWEKRMVDPLADLETLKVDSLGNIVELGKRPSSYNDIQGQYMGLFVIRHATLSALCAFYHRLDRSLTYGGRHFDNMHMTDFIQTWIDAGNAVKAVRVDQPWLEVDSLADLSVDCGPIDGEQNR